MPTLLEAVDSCDVEAVVQLTATLADTERADSTSVSGVTGQTAALNNSEPADSSTILASAPFLNRVQLPLQEVADSTITLVSVVPPLGSVPAWASNTNLPLAQAREISLNTMNDVWQGAQPAGDGTLEKGIAWCSAVDAPGLGQFGSKIAAGGGDADSWDTAAFAFDYGAQVWTRIKDRTTALTWNPANDPQYNTTYCEHGDGTPAAPHSYDLYCFLPSSAGGGIYGSLMRPVSRFMYTTTSTNFSHRLIIGPSNSTSAWTRAGSCDSNINLLGMCDYDPTTKRVWVLPSTSTGSYSSAVQFMDFSAGTGTGVPGAVLLGQDYLIYSGTMRFWTGIDGSKRYLIWLSYALDSRLHIIDLDNPQLGVRPLTIVYGPATPSTFGYPGSGFDMAANIGFAIHPQPETDGNIIYEIVPPTGDAVTGTWTVNARLLTGITIAGGYVNNGAWKRLQIIPSFNCVTFFLHAGGPVYAYRSSTLINGSINPPPPPPPTGSFAMDEMQVTRDYWNGGLGIHWLSQGGASGLPTSGPWGDWSDANGTLNHLPDGTINVNCNVPYGVSGNLIVMDINNGDPPQRIDITITSLVQDWKANGNRGMLIRGGTARIGSREGPANLAPFITINNSLVCADVSDVTIDGGVVGNIGDRTTLAITVGENDIEHPALQFDLTGIAGVVSSAVLTVWGTKVEQTTPIQVYRLEPPVGTSGTPPSIIGATASPFNLPSGGGSTTLSATVLNATSTTVDGVTVTLPYTTAVTASHNFDLVAHGNFAPDAEAFIPVTVASAPPPPPPPPGGTGTLKMTSTAIPYQGPGAALGSAKHQNFQPLNGIWYRVCGDNIKIDSNAPDWQDGRQEIPAVQFSTNTWTLAQHYFLRSGDNKGTMQGALPDDAGAVTVGNEIWVVPCERVSQLNTADQTALVRAGYGADIVTQNMEDICAWNPATGFYRVVLSPRPQELRGDRAWFCLYDSVNQRVITPIASGFITLDAQTGADITPRYGSNNLPQDYGNYDFHATQIVQDGRTAYVYDQAHGALYRFSLDAWPSYTLQKVLDLPQCTYTSAGRGIQMVWHPVIRAVIIADVYQQMFGFEVDTGKLTTWTRTDGFINGVGNYVAPSYLLYDPGTAAIYGMGSIDWDTGIVSPNYWKVTITT